MLRLPGDIPVQPNRRGRGTWALGFVLVQGRYRGIVNVSIIDDNGIGPRGPRSCRPRCHLRLPFFIHTHLNHLLVQGGHHHSVVIWFLNRYKTSKTNKIWVIKTSKEEKTVDLLLVLGLYSYLYSWRTIVAGEINDPRIQPSDPSIHLVYPYPCTNSADSETHMERESLGDAREDVLC